MMLLEPRLRTRSDSPPEWAPGGKLRVLILAEACNPTWSSVPLVGYNIAKALARRGDLDVTIATQIRNRAGLENNELASLARIHYIDNDGIAGPAFRFGRWLRGGQTNGWTINTALAWPAYIAFERGVEKQFRRELLGGGFDLIHRVTPVSPALPSPLVKWSKVPVILGPLNGGLPWPKEYPELRKREKEWMLKFRKLHKFLPYSGTTYRKAAAILTASRFTESELPPGTGKRFALFENGVDPERFAIAQRWNEPSGPFRFITVGRLAAGKAVDCILEAIAASPILRACRFSIVGDGPERAKLEGIIREQKLESIVELAGWLDQKAVSAKLRESQAFVFPSLKEFGGGAVMEAMSAGLPCIVSAYGGPGEIISPETGLRIPMVKRDEMIHSIRQAMEKLAADSPLCRSMAAAALERVNGEFLWSKKAERIVEIYRDVLQQRRTP